ncbi:hypothetical protein ABPG74_020363 [Tetrahymena malaccensis]
MPGKVSITLHRIEVKRKEQKFKSMHPWAVVMFDGQKKTTQPVQNGDLQPEFNQTWVFQRNSDVNITVSIYKKEYTYDALKNEKEIDLLIGKGKLNILSVLKKAIHSPQDISVDLVYDFDNKLAAQAYLSIQFTPGADLEEYRNQEQVKQIKSKYESCLTVTNLQLTLDSFKPEAYYYLKIRNSNGSHKTAPQNGGKSMMFQGEFDIYFRGQKIVYIDVQEVLRDEILDFITGDDLVGIGTLDFEKMDINQSQQKAIIRHQGKQIGSVQCQTSYQIYKQEQPEEQISLIRQSNDQLLEQIKSLEKKDRFWLSPERYQLDLKLKKKQILDRRQMLMKNRSSAPQLGNESYLFLKNDERNIVQKPDIVISTTTVKLPKLKTNNNVEVPTQYSKQYFRDIHGVGFSTVESSSSLQRSVPKFTIPEQKRFVDPKDIFPGPGRYGTSGVANDLYLPKKFQKITAISEVRTTKQDRKERVQIDTGLKKPIDKQQQQTTQNPK